MDTQYDLGPDHERAIVYVRAVKVDELPAELRQQMGGIETLYAVHNTDGERLALVKDRKMAFFLARQHDMEPVTVH